MTDNIVRIPEEIRNEFKIDTDGKAFVFIRGTARLADVDHKALVKSFKKTGDLYTSKLAEMLAAQGFDPGDFSETGIPDIALSIILKYYAYKANRTNDRASRAIL